MQATSIRNAVVSGAASGLGEDISAALVAEGYRVFGTTLDEESAGDRDGIVLSKVDVSDPAAVRAWAADVAAATGGSVDLLISNAGILTPGPLEVIPFEDIVHEFEVNTFGPLHLVNAFLPQLREAQGRIVQISSISAVYPVPFNAPSAASKAAAEALLAANGAVAWLTDEAQIDAVTAASGSGPAYVFLLAETLAEAGIAAGLEPEVARSLARATVAGAGALLDASPAEAAELRRNVTSPGGTTAAALEVLMRPDGLGALMREAVAAARRRAGELSG